MHIFDPMLRLHSSRAKIHVSGTVVDTERDVSA